ncbi:MAG: GAF domain-containing protein [Chloroflexota bacterium]
MGSSPMTTNQPSGRTPVLILAAVDEQEIGRARTTLEQGNYRVAVVEKQGDGRQPLPEECDVALVIGPWLSQAGRRAISRLTIQHKQTALVLLAPAGQESTVALAMKLGVHDYILQDPAGAYLALLPHVVQQALRHRRLVAEKEQATSHLQRRGRELLLLNYVGQLLTATLDLQRVMEQLLQAVTEIMAAEGSSVWLWDEENPGWLVCRMVYNQGQHRPLTNLRLGPGQGVVGWVAQSGDSLVVPSVTQDARFSREIDSQSGFQTRSLLAVPLRVQDHIIGVLELVNKVNGHFHQEDLSLVETLAASAAIAIENARLVGALRQQTADLQARNEDLDAYAQTVAHDLQSPLAHVVGFADALQQELPYLSPEELSAHLQTIARNGRKMSRIVNELLLLASLRRVEVEMRPLDMEGIVAESLQRLGPMIQEYQAQITVPTHWPAALGHAPWVEEMWVNYLSNALKYGGPSPKVELGATQTGNGVVRFYVRDYGPGLSADDQAQLFKPFTRLEQGQTRGYGLGLSIVRRIATKLGGQASVESQVGEGSAFSFTLPAGADGA